MGNEIYETDQLVSDYLFFHYADKKDFLPWEFGPSDALDFPVRTAVYAEGRKYAKALDLGCAVGRSSFKLTEYAEDVLGIDFSHAFVEAAAKMGAGEVVNVKRNSGEFSLKAPEGYDLTKMKFAQGDAMKISEMGTFDLIHASNLLCRLPNPTKFLEDVSSALNPRGRLILATPFSWLEEYTSKDQWPEGDSWEWLQDQLRSEFDLVKHSDEPFMIREHARKYQWCVSKVSVWQKK